MLSINEKPSDYFKSPPIIKSKKILWNKIQTQDAKRQAKNIQVLYYDKEYRYTPHTTIYQRCAEHGERYYEYKLKELNTEYLEPSWLSNNIKENSSLHLTTK